MRTIPRIPQSWDGGALLLRVVVGLVFILHGSQKVFGAFGGHGPSGVVAMVAQLGFPAAPLWAFLLMFAELGGGLMLLFGVLTELAAGMVAVDMGVAIFKVFLPRGAIGPQGLPSFQLEAVLLAVALALILGGPGRYALWNPFGRRE